MPALPSLLQPSIVNERVSRLKVTNNTLQVALGMQAGGPAVRKTASRRGSYDVFNDTREVATMRLPGASAATVARQPVGNVTFTIPRSAEKVPILLEEVNQLRAIGGPVDGVDELGEQYILDQERIQKQRYTALREFQIASMLRGSYTYTQSGDDLVHSFSGGTYTVNYRVPAGNKSQLDMLGGGDIIGTTWSNAAAPIVRDLLQINAAMTQLVGMGLTDVWVSSVVWGHIITNTEVLNLAGSVNNPVKSFERNMDTNEAVAELNGAPWVKFHITDNGLSIGGVFYKLISDTLAVFTCKMGNDIVSYYECAEPILDPGTQRTSNEYGEYYYYKAVDDPVQYELHARFNGMPVLKVPSAIACGTVVF